VVATHHNTPMNLESVTPAEAVQLYLKDREAEISKSTIYEHKTRLRRFVEWADKNGIKDTATLTRQTLFRYKAHRTEEVAPTTLENEMRTVRLFVRFCENFGCCPEGIAASITIPSAPKSKRSRDEQLTPDRAEKILDYLDTYQYCSFQHVLFAFMWKLGARIGGIRALDVEDFHESSPDGPYIEFVHRPETGTPLKNGWKSARKPPIREPLASLVEDFLEARRPPVTDVHGRRPLLATKQGRPAKTTIQRNIYALTRPCVYDDDCPHEREISECTAAARKNNASKCPPSRSPHTLRRGRATEASNNGMPEEMVCDRMDMTPEVFREHYRQSTEEDKRKLQREYLDS